MPQSYVYVIGPRPRGPVKIGYTSKVPESRLKSIQTGHPERLHILWSVEGDMALEFSLHERFKDYRTVGEWFDFGDLDPVAAIREAVFELRGIRQVMATQTPRPSPSPRPRRTPKPKVKPIPILSTGLRWALRSWWWGWCRSWRWWRKASVERRAAELGWRTADVAAVAVFAHLSAPHLPGWWLGAQEASAEITNRIVAHDFGVLDIIAAILTCFALRWLSPLAKRWGRVPAAIPLYFVRPPLFENHFRRLSRAITAPAPESPRR